MKNIALAKIIRDLASIWLIVSAPALFAQQLSADVLIKGGEVYFGNHTGKKLVDIALCNDIICGIFPSSKPSKVNAKYVIQAQGKIVSPGFIDPHTHSLSELLSKNKNHNLNYLTQGVTTVVNGNDGGGPADLKALITKLTNNGMGTNTALFTGHNSIRKAVLGKENRAASDSELQQMMALVDQAMQEGALGLSSGLYYVPGTYATTQEVIALAKVAARHNGIYDTHLRSESDFSAIDEAIAIAKAANIPLHLAHIKALGVDVWEKAQQAIDKIESAQNQGVQITADQYPWLASGTQLHNAIMPKWLMADSVEAFHQRLNDPAIADTIIKEINNNIRRRGGAQALLITEFKNPSYVGLTLADVAKLTKQSPAQTAITLVQQGRVRIASFNMKEASLIAFMRKNWVVTSSDGSNGHPRKYASFPQKYQEYVIKNPMLTIDDFISNSSGKTAKILGIANRGIIKKGNFADIIVFDPVNFKPNASYQQWDKLSSGVEHVFVNGKQVVKTGNYTGVLAGRYLPKK